ncbi:TPA: hypothetical protein ACYZ6U_000322 [Escherichia coli]|uniref:hypothetical protein n=1 Tax=Escherichia coli TaxID=562 RepID=UPI000BB7FFDC|nr:hypothetical protein [Escherichia coli]EFO0495858.1 hypothetical protein [Escherichia coli]EGO4719215.1 hypothetical protein [Escherichia coli]EHP6582809.1 hypothetical protein [Escherichia coli]EKM4516353.1 hypothetical protein [Escherichia coli]ELN8631417.1 hypothetical protein [Escherichia coli]
MSNIDKQALNPAELESALRELKRISEQPAVSTHYARVLRKYIANLEGKLESAEKRIAELETRKAKTVWPDIDMSDADCFTITRLHEIICASELKWPEAKLLARFMHDVKQRAGTAKGE